MYANDIGNTKKRREINVVNSQHNYIHQSFDCYHIPLLLFIIRVTRTDSEEPTNYTIEKKYYIIEIVFMSENVLLGQFQELLLENLLLGLFPQLLLENLLPGPIPTTIARESTPEIIELYLEA